MQPDMFRTKVLSTIDPYFESIKPVISHMRSLLFPTADEKFLYLEQRDRFDLAARLRQAKKSDGTRISYKELVEIFHIIIKDGLDRLSQSIEPDLKDPVVNSQMDIAPNRAMDTRRLPRRAKVEVQTLEDTDVEMTEDE